MASNIKDAKNYILDRSKIKIPEGTMEDFKRPNHPDFMSSSELKVLKFSGLRHNSLTDRAEIWVLGNLEREITRTQILLDPMAINKAWADVFALDEVLPDIPELRAYHERMKKEKGE